MKLPRALAILLPLCSLPWGVPACAEPDGSIAAALRAHIAVLASDAFEGRKPGTPGGAKSQAYIAAQFRAAGLRPGARGGGWFQAVDLIHREADVVRAKVSVRRAKATKLPEGSIVMIGPDRREQIFRAPLIFVGYGVTDASHSTLAGIDARGAVLLVTNNPPEGMEPVLQGDRRRLFAEAGAAAMVTVLDHPQSMQVAVAGTDSLASEITIPILRGAILPSESDTILRAAGVDQAALLAAATKPGFRPVRIAATLDATIGTRVRRFSAANVIGLLPGRDPAGEAIAYMAHWDHLGICRPPGAADRICNGAVDNASGVATLIEIARAQVAAPRAPRDMLFVATTAEEMGLLGAEAFAADPPRPLSRIVAALNIDTIAITDHGQPVAIIGRGITPALDRVVDAVTRSLGRVVDGDTDANSLVRRQDGWALGRRGLPSVMIGGSFSDMKVLDRFLGTDYHTPTDDMAHLPPLGGAAEDVVLHVAVGAALADRSRYAARPR